MKKQLLTIAAAAAMACGSMTLAADETNRAAHTDANISGSHEGQTGASNNSASGGTSSSASGSGATGSGLQSTGATGSAAGDMAQAGTSATGESDIRQALNSANDPDKFFLVCAAIDNTAEIQLGQLAQSKATDPQVKQVAQQMIQDHTQAQQQLKQAAQQAGVTLPQSVPAIKQQEMRVMQSLSGKEFDQQYISKLQASHAQAVNEYQSVAQLAKNDQVKDYASKTLPSLQTHLQHIQQAAVALGLPNSNDPQTAGARMGGSDIGDKSKSNMSGR